MPFLIHQGYKIDFSTIQPQLIPQLPAALVPAASLITQWHSGQAFFPLQTSGSTGMPKMIQLERAKIAYSASLTASAFGLKPGDTLFCCLGLHYIAGFMMVMRAVVNDCNLVIAEPVSNPLKDLDTDQKIDFASFIPIQMETMLEDHKTILKMNRMKAILLGGGPVSDTLAEKLQIIKAPIYHTYSMTETYTHVAVKLLNTRQRTSVYQPLTGVSLSVDERGCLVINSYITDNQDLVTNDLVELYTDGSFTWLGRYDNVINSGGVKIQLEKIEMVCNEVFKILGLTIPFFAAGLPDEKLGEKLILVVEGEKWENSIIKEVNDQLSARLGKYEVPKNILFVKEILTTRTGKIDRQASLNSGLF